MARKASFWVFLSSVVLELVVGRQGVADSVGRPTALATKTFSQEFDISLGNNAWLHSCLSLPEGNYSTKDPISELHLVRTRPEKQLLVLLDEESETEPCTNRLEKFRSMHTSRLDSMMLLTADLRGGSTGPRNDRTGELAILQWVVDVAEVPPRSIVVYGRSTSVAATAEVAEKFATADIPIFFASLVLHCSMETTPRPWLKQYSQAFQAFVRTWWASATVGSRINNIVRAGELRCADYRVLIFADASNILGSQCEQLSYKWFQQGTESVDRTGFEIERRAADADRVVAARFASRCGSIALQIPAQSTRDRSNVAAAIHDEIVARTDAKSNKGFAQSLQRALEPIGRRVRTLFYSADFALISCSLAQLAMQSNNSNGMCA